jgi:radical SAM enzyme (rSAM/lipoprotein system)
MTKLAHPGLKQKLALELFRQYRNNEKALHQLTYLFWECTLRCNLNCGHCGSDCRTASSVPDMPLRDFIRVIDEIRPHVEPHNTTIVVTGGEPLLRNDLEKCGQELYAREFPWGIVTNGFQLTEKRFTGLMNVGMRALSMSLDGFETSHTHLRGRPESYARAVAALDFLAKADDLHYDIVTCANQYNFAELADFCEMLIAKQVKEWRIFTVFPKGRAVKDSQLQLSNQQFKQLMDFIAETRKSGRIKVSYGCEGFLGKYEGAVRDNFFFCRAGISIASVLADGSISACPSMRSSFVQGNIYQNNFSEIWDNKFELFRNRRWMKTGICASCKMFRYCEGNGMHLRNGSSDPMVCHFNKLNNTAE